MERSLEAGRASKASEASKASRASEASRAPKPHSWIMIAGRMVAAETNVIAVDAKHIHCKSLRRQVLKQAT